MGKEAERAARRAAAGQDLHKEGATMHPEYTDFANEDSRRALAEQLSSGEYSNVRRNAGLGIYEVAMGLTSTNDLVEAMVQEPETIWLCIDEHSETVREPGTLCAHTSCGAAAGVYGAIRNGNEQAIRNIEDVVGESTINDVQSEKITSDELGVRWAKALQQRLMEKGISMNVETVAVQRYSHHGHEIHSATGISVHLKPQEQSNFAEGKPQEKSFIYTVLNGSEKAMLNGAREAALAAWIAGGSHGLGQEIDSFAVIVRDLSSDKQDLFKATANEYLQTLGGKLTLQFFFE